MRLTKLLFHRGAHEWDQDVSKPLHGVAEFDGFNNGKIHIKLNEEQTNAILEICKDTIRASVQEGLQSMDNFLIEQGAQTPKLTQT